MIVFFKWAVKSFQRNAAYRLEYFVSIFNAFLYITIFTSLWGALFAHGVTKNGLTRELMINYAVFVTLIKVTIVKTRDMIGQRVRTGEIAIDLTRPFSLPLMTLADAVGSWLFQVFSRAIPLIIVSALVFDIQFPIGIDFEFLLSYVLSFLIFHAMLFFFGVLSFFITENLPVWLFNSAAVSLLSGSILPLEILPAIVGKFALLTPYPYLFYLPTMKLVKGHFPMDYAIMKQIIVLLITYSIGFFVYVAGRKKLHIQGG
jgi:ABC-2 type transport system permease protein